MAMQADILRIERQYCVYDGLLEICPSLRHRAGSIGAMRIRTAVNVVAVTVGLRAITLLVKALIEKLKNVDKYEGLDSVVSFSSRMIAAARAVETREEHALVRDPLAEVLAGSKAFQRKLSREQEMPAGGPRKKQIGLMAIRTRWFDDQILAALGVAVAAAAPAALLEPPSPKATQGAEEKGQWQGGGASNAAVAAAAGQEGEAPASVPATVRQQAAQPEAETEGAEGPYVVGWSELVMAGREPPRQVVLLGAGMDSRPWRLDLPKGVHWFEVDRQDVLDAKKQLLAGANVQFDSAGAGSNEGAAPQPTNGGLAAAAGSANSTGSAAAAGFAYPLRAASWTGVACDLCSPGWAKALRGAGFDSAQPTLWVAEGLLMYLTREEVEALLREMADASAPGSVLMAVSITEGVVEDIQRRGASSELTGTWKFGCPPDPRQFLSARGWRQEHAITRGQMARRLRLDPAFCGFKMDGGAATARSVFFVASVAAHDVS